MKVLSLTAFAATLALSSIAFASPGGPVDPYYGAGGPAVGPGYAVPPVAPPYARDNACLVRTGEPFWAQVIPHCIPPQTPTKCVIQRLDFRTAVITVVTPGNESVLTWFGLADDHGAIEGRLRALYAFHLCSIQPNRFIDGPRGGGGEFDGLGGY